MYRKLIVPDPTDADKLLGDLAEKWEVSKDGLTFTFQIRRGVVFESGKPLTADDAAFSLQRVVKLNKTPGFILTQFGWNADNVEKMITRQKRIRPGTETARRRRRAPSCCTACPPRSAAWSRRPSVLANQTNGDLGNAWLKSHSAGSGQLPPGRLGRQRPDHPRDQSARGGKAAHRTHCHPAYVGEPAAQLLLVQKGDADIARDLNADQLKPIVNARLHASPRPTSSRRCTSAAT